MKRLKLVLVIFISYMMGNDIKKKEIFIPLLVYIIAPIILYSLYSVGLVVLGKIGDYDCEQKYKVLLCLFLLLFN